MEPTRSNQPRLDWLGLALGWYAGIEMEIRQDVDVSADVPIYRQLGAHLRRMIETGDVVRGDRVPPTRELAVQLGLNRTTVSAAYEVLEAGGLIKGSVGRGS